MRLQNRWHSHIIGVKLLLILLLILSVLLSAPQKAFAQTAYGLLINSIETSDDEDGLKINVYFTIYDTVSGTVINNANISYAEIILLDSDTTFDVGVKQPESPFYISLVLDASGSMYSSAADMRKAAIEAINAPPENARFSVISFNEDINILSDFLGLENTNLIEEAIRKVQPITNKGTCLYDATYKALSELEKAPPGRRAVILFTDGRDELANGDPCSRQSYEEVVTYAAQNNMRVPVNTIGLAGQKNPLNSEELRNLALTTGGFSAIGGENNLEALFEQIMDALKSQWLAQSTLYVRSGNNSALLKITLNDGSTISEIINFTAHNDYTLPPDPVSINLEGWTFNYNENFYNLEMMVVSPELIDHLRVSIWDKSSGNKVYEAQFVDMNKKVLINIPAENLQNNVIYNLRVAAFDPENQPIPTSNNELYFIEHDFKYNLTNTVVIDTVSFEHEKIDTMIIGLLVEDINKISYYEGWLIDEGINAKVPQSQFTASNLEDDMSLRIPMEEIPQGKYSLILRTLNDNGVILSASEYQNISYIPTRPEPLLSRAMRGMKQNPLILIAIILIFLIITLWLIITSIRNKKATGTPVLQGVVEAKFSNDRVLPISNTTEFDFGKTDPFKNKYVISPSVPVLTITVIHSKNMEITGKVFKFEKIPLSIGRENCDINIPDDPSISRKHANITFDEALQQFMITDLSRNGISLNGSRIMNNVPVPVKAGTEIGIGPKTFIKLEY